LHPDKAAVVEAAVVPVAAAVRGQAAHQKHPAGVRLTAAHILLKKVQRMSRQNQASSVNMTIYKYRQSQDDGSIAVINAESYFTSRKEEGEKTGKSRTLCKL